MYLENIFSKTVFAIFLIVLIAGLGYNFSQVQAEPFLSRIPSGPTLPGVFDVVTDSSGNIYAVFGSNVGKYNSTGTVLLEFGSYGSDEGTINGPRSLARDSSGNFYVVEAFNHRVQKFDSAGNFVMMFGWGVDTGSNLFQTCTSSCQAGISGSGDGQFSSPQGVAVDNSDNIYVVDSNNNRIQKFDSAGAFLSKFGTSGSGNGQFNNPQGMAFDNSGKIYVTDTNNNRIQKFNSTGTFESTFGLFGSSEGQLKAPHDITLDISDNIYVTDRDNRRIQKFDSAGNFVMMFGWGVDSGSSAFEVCTSDCQSGISGSGDGQFSTPQGIAVGGSGDIFVTDNNNHRIQKFSSTGSFQSKFGSLGSEENQFNSPNGIARDSSGNIYVAEAFNHRVQKFDSAGNFVMMFGWGVDTGSSSLEVCTSSCQAGILGSGDGQFSSPKGIVVDSSGNIYVADSNNSRIQKFDSAGMFQSKFGTFCWTVTENGCVDPDGGGPLELGDGQFYDPLDIVLDSSENLLVIDSSNHRVQKFDSSGNFISKITGFFTFPQGIGLDSSDNIYVADTANNRVQKLNSTGSLEVSFGSFGTADGFFKSPRDVAVDSSGNPYVVDTNNGRIQKFNSTGGFLSKFGLTGSAGGQFSLSEKVVLDSSGKIYVADSGNNRVEIFGVPSCDVPNSGNWLVTENCLISSDVVTPAGITVQNNSLVTINPGVTVTIPSGHNLTVKSGSGVLIKSGGTMNIFG